MHSSGCSSGGGFSGVESLTRTELMWSTALRRNSDNTVMPKLWSMKRVKKNTATRKLSSWTCFEAVKYADGIEVTHWSFRKINYFSCHAHVKWCHCSNINWSSNASKPIKNYIKFAHLATENWKKWYSSSSSRWNTAGNIAYIISKQ